MEEVKSKKIVVLGQNETVDRLISNDRRFHRNNDNTPADVVVRVWDVDTVNTDGTYKFSFEKIPANTPVIFVCTQKAVGEVWDRDEKIQALQIWAANNAINALVMDKPINAHNAQAYFSHKLDDTISFLERREAFQREFQQAQERVETERLEIIEQSRQLLIQQRTGVIRDFTPEQIKILKHAEELVKPRSRAVRSVKADVQPLPFFGYGFANPEQASVSHSRQERNNYLEDNLRFSDDDSDQENMKKLILLFAHYKSIRHVKSTLSERLEDILAKKLLDEAEYEDYKNNRTNDRATIRGKKYDRVALQLEDVLRARARIFHNRDLNKKIDVLVDILDSVDDLERGFFSYKSESGKAQMKGAMELASKTYDKITENRRDLNPNDVTELTRGLALPKSARKAVEKLVPDLSVNPLI